jgi:hypothetical protein
MGLENEDLASKRKCWHDEIVGYTIEEEPAGLIADTYQYPELNVRVIEVLEDNAEWDEWIYLKTNMKNNSTRTPYTGEHTSRKLVLKVFSK